MERSCKMDAYSLQRNIGTVCFSISVEETEAKANVINARRHGRV